MIVVFCDLEHALTRHIAAAQHIFEKRKDIGRLFRPAERNQKKRVDRP